MLDDTQAIAPDDDGPDSGELPAYAPPPPVVKPTVASLLVEWLKTLDYGLRAVEVNQDDLYTQSARSLAHARLLAYFAIGLFAVSLLVSIATLAMLAALVGHLW